MFDTVLGHTDSRRRVGTGAVISIAFHAAVLTAGLWISARAIAPATRADPIIKFWPGTGGGGGKRAALKAAQVAPAQTHPHPKHALVAPTQITDKVVPTAEPTPVTGEPVLPGGSTVDGTPDGNSDGTCTGDHCAKDGTGPEDGQPGGRIGDGNTDGPIIMRPGMTQPVLLSGPAIQLTTEALAARVQGTVLVKCALTADGFVNSCHVLKSLPFMDDVVVRALQARHYKPVTFEGKPVSVWYIFSMQITQH